MRGFIADLLKQQRVEGNSIDGDGSVSYVGFFGGHGGGRGGGRGGFGLQTINETSIMNIFLCNPLVTCIWLSKCTTQHLFTLVKVV